MDLSFFWTLKIYMSDSKLNNLGGASSEHGFFIRSVMANGNGWLLYSLVVTIVCSFHGLLQKWNITKTIWFAKLKCIINLQLRKKKICLLNVLWKKLDQSASKIDRQWKPITFFLEKFLDRSEVGECQKPPTDKRTYVCSRPYCGIISL